MKPFKQADQPSAMRPDGAGLTLPRVPDSRQQRQAPTCMFCRYRRAPAPQQEASHA